MTTKNKKSNKSYLLSYPRSGNTWTRYILEYISKRPTMGCKGSLTDTPICMNKLKGDPLKYVDKKGKPIAYKVHDEAWFRAKKNTQKDRLILVTREPCSVINRHCGKFMWGNYGLKSYIDILKVYDKWEGEKIALKYETLINNPFCYISDIATFLEFSHSSVVEFMLNYEQHKASSVAKYNDDPHTGGSKTKGNYIKKPKKIDIMKLWILLFFTGNLKLKKYF